MHKKIAHMKIKDIHYQYTLKYKNNVPNSTDQPESDNKYL